MERRDPALSCGVWYLLHNRSGTWLQIWRCSLDVRTRRVVWHAAVDRGVWSLAPMGLVDQPFVHVWRVCVYLNSIEFWDLVGWLGSRYHRSWRW